MNLTTNERFSPGFHYSNREGLKATDYDVLFKNWLFILYLGACTIWWYSYVIADNNNKKEPGSDFTN